MSKALIRKAVKLCKKHGFVNSKPVKHGQRLYNTNGSFIQISSSPRTDAFYKSVIGDIARILCIPKIQV